MASTSKPEVKTEVETEVKVEENVAKTEEMVVGVTADCGSEDSNDSDGDGDDGDDDFFSAAIEAILPICGKCGAGRCRYVINDSGRVFLNCCIKKGFGACGFSKLLDAQKIAESQKRIQELAKKQQELSKKQG